MHLLLPPQTNTHTVLTCLKLENEKKEMLKPLTVNTAAISDYNNDEDNEYLYLTHDQNVLDA